MGNIENKSPNSLQHGDYASQAEFLSKLHYIGASHNKKFGQIKIYRFKEAPYDYIMKQNRSLSQNKAAEFLLNTTLSYIHQELSHKNISKVHFYQTNKKFNMCVNSTEYALYRNYYTITLKQVIDNHKANDISFTEPELWYTIRSLNEVYRFLNSKHFFMYQTFKSNDITISAEGYIKLFPFKLIQQLPTNRIQLPSKSNKESLKSLEQYGSTLLERALQNRSNLCDYFPLPPEYLPIIKQGNHELSILNQNTQSLQKEQVFIIGMIVMEMIIEEDIRKYYNYNITSEHFCLYKSSTVWKDLCLIKKAYPQLYPLLQKMLQPNPRKRSTPKQIIEFIEQNQDNLNIGGSIRMFDENNNQQKISYRANIDFQSSVFQGISPNLLQSKLTAGPIQTVNRRDLASSRSLSQSEIDKNSSKYSLEQKIKKSFGFFQFNDNPHLGNAPFQNPKDLTDSEVKTSYRNKSTSLIDSSNRNLSSLNLNVSESNIHYQVRGEGYNEQNNEKQIENIDYGNMANMADGKGRVRVGSGITLTSSKQSKQNSEQKSKMCKIKMNRRGTSLALKTNKK